MHIEPGVVDGAKLTLSIATAAGAIGLSAKMAMDTIRNDGGVRALALGGDAVRSRRRARGPGRRRVVEP